MASLSSDFEGDIESYEWFQDTVSLGTDRILVISDFSDVLHVNDLVVTDDRVGHGYGFCIRYGHGSWGNW